MSIEEVGEKLALGWTFAEARMGKDWESKYPNIASWQGGYYLFGSQGTGKISLIAACGSDFSGFHTTTYTLFEQEHADPDKYRAVDEVIQQWTDEHGLEAVLRFKKGWIGEAGWEARYPHIAHWISQGKRHCISIKINLVTHKSSAKAWLYDKPSDTETVLFEQEAENMTEHEVLKMLDEGIAVGLSKLDE